MSQVEAPVVLVEGCRGSAPMAHAVPLRRQSDERLVALVRRGEDGAFEALFRRYQPRLLAFCRRMVGSTEDAEDVLQEVFVSAYRAIRADERPINARPWLYQIARNRCLSHLRRPVPSGRESIDVFERQGGPSTEDAVQRREEFRRIVADVRELPQTQRSALLLREIDAFSHEQIAEALDTTVPAVKSLLVRARTALTQAAEARHLTCDEVRLELAEVMEGQNERSPATRRHLKACAPCRAYARGLRRSRRALVAAFPLWPLIFLRRLLGSKLALGTGAGGAGGAAATSGAGGATAVSAGAAAGGAVMTTGLASKAGTGLAVAVLAASGGAADRLSERSDSRAHPGAGLMAPAPARESGRPALGRPRAALASDPSGRAARHAHKPEPSSATPGPAPSAAPAVAASALSSATPTDTGAGTVDATQADRSGPQAGATSVRRRAGRRLATRRAIACLRAIRGHRAPAVDRRPAAESPRGSRGERRAPATRRAGGRQPALVGRPAPARRSRGAATTPTAGARWPQAASRLAFRPRSPAVRRTGAALRRPPAHRPPAWRRGRLTRTPAPSP